MEERQHIPCSELLFHENIAESIKISDLNKDGIYWYNSYALHSAKFEKWAIISGMSSETLLRMSRWISRKVNKSHKTLQLLPIFRCKYTSKADFKSSLTYNICESAFAFEDPDARYRIRNYKGIEMLTSA